MLSYIITRVKNVVKRRRMYFLLYFTILSSLKLVNVRFFKRRFNQVFTQVLTRVTDSLKFDTIQFIL